MFSPALVSATGLAKGRDRRKIAVNMTDRRTEPETSNLHSRAGSIKAAEPSKDDNEHEQASASGKRNRITQRAHNSGNTVAGFYMLPA